MIKDLLEGEVIAENVYRSKDAKSASGEVPIVSSGIKLTSSIINKLIKIFGADYSILINDNGNNKNELPVNDLSQLEKEIEIESQNEAKRINISGKINRETALEMYKEIFHNKEKYKYTREKLIEVFEKIQGVMQDFKTTKILNENILSEVSLDLTTILKNPNSDFDPSLIYIIEMEKWDEITFNHSFDVAVIALTFATAFTSEKQELASIFLAGLIHDIGKYLYSKFHLNAMDYIIKKESRLTEEEYEQIKRHVDVEDFLQHCFKGLSERYRQNIIYAASEHHEKYSGGGYGKNKKGMEISFAGRLVAICDVYDALLRERRYKHAMKPNLVINFIQDLTNKGQFDPIMFKKFLRTFGKYPVGSVIKTNQGTGVIVEQTHDYLNPIVFIPSIGEIDTSKNDSVKITEDEFLESN